MKRKPNQQKDHDAPQKIKPQIKQSPSMNNKEKKEAWRNVNNGKNIENDKEDIKRLQVTIVGTSLLNGIDGKIKMNGTT